MTKSLAHHWYLQGDGLPGEPRRVRNQPVRGCAARQDKGRLFVELNRDGLDELRREIAERSVPTQKAWWGYDVTIRMTVRARRDDRLTSD